VNVNKIFRINYKMPQYADMTSSLVNTDCDCKLYYSSFQSSKGNGSKIHITFRSETYYAYFNIFKCVRRYNALTPSVSSPLNLILLALLGSYTTA
jgi:hypothetical protein